MCLVIVASRVHPEAPLVVAANRDELYARPSAPAQVLRQTPRTLGGRDELAFGTWLAVNEHGVVAALTNQRGPVRDASKRSRGELPLLLTAEATAEAAVARFVERARAEDYNACCLLVGDARSLHYVELLAPGPPTMRELPPGVVVLENRPLDADSPKAELVHACVRELPRWPAAELPERLRAVLANPQIPARALKSPTGERPPELEAALVRTPLYGTRSSSLAVAGGARVPPRLWVTTGPPSDGPFLEVSTLFT